jgi:hypothetical protein
VLPLFLRLGLGLSAADPSALASDLVPTPEQRPVIPRLTIRVSRFSGYSLS